jgi:ABC-type dipeptide/oligopeptide/nickel transport system permease subunit
MTNSVTVVVRDTTEPATQGPAKGSARSQVLMFARRFLRHRVAVASLVVLAVIIAMALAARQLTPYTFDGMNLRVAKLPPTMTGRHWFGTDQLGRDYFTRVVFGTRTTLLVSFIVAILSTAIGTFVGAVAGFFGGWVDNLLMRVTDLVIILPGLAVLMILIAFTGEGSPLQVACVLASLFWTLIARIVRAQFLSLRQREFVQAARLAGASDLRLIWRHILPNAVGPIIVNATLTVSRAILTESGLSFIGFGVKPPTPALGQLIAQARGMMQTQWWLVTFPGIMIVVICLAINYVGDGLRDAIDARQSGRG